MGDAAAGAEGLLPVDVIEQEQAHGALQHGAGTDLKDIEPGKGAGHRGQQHGPQGADAAEAEMQAGQTEVHDHVDDAGQGDDLMHRQEHDQKGEGHHGATDAADAGHETACDPGEEHTDLCHPGHTPLLRPEAAPSVHEIETPLPLRPVRRQRETRMADGGRSVPPAGKRPVRRGMPCPMALPAPQDAACRAGRLSCGTAFSHQGDCLRELPAPRSPARVHSPRCGPRTPCLGGSRPFGNREPGEKTGKSP